MFMLDHWEALEADKRYDPKTLRVAKELAFEMLDDLIDRLGLSTMMDETSLRVAGRGVTVVVPLRGINVPLKYPTRKGTSRKGVYRRSDRALQGEK